MSRPAARYMFDEVFAIGVEREEPPAPIVDEEAVARAAEAAREEGRSAGHAAGRAEAEKDLAARLAACTKTLAEKVAPLARRMEEAEAARTEDAVRLAVAVARKLCASLLEREPTAEIEALVRESLSAIGDAPHLVIRVHDDAADSLRETVEQMASRQGFRGRILVMPDPGISPGDGRVDWADGGAVREQAKIDEAVTEAVERYLAASRGDGAGSQGA